MNTEPGFDFWTTLFALLAASGHGTAVFLFFKSYKQQTLGYLAWIILLFACLLTEWVLWWTGYVEMVPIAKGITLGFPFFLGVLLLCYYRGAFNASGKFESHPVQVWHYLPGILFFLKMSSYYLGNIGIRVPDWNHITYLNKGLDAAIYLMFIHFAVYPIWIYRFFRSRMASNTELLRWHRWILGAYGCIVASYWLHHVLTLLGAMNPRLDFIIAFFIAAFMSLVGWLGYVQPRILAGMSFLEAITLHKYLKSSLSETAAAALTERLLKAFETEKWHLDSELTLGSTAKKLNATRHHVSQVVNSAFGMNFSEWVAQWRVREAQQLLDKPQNSHLIIKEIAWQSGFNTKAAFNLAFKKMTGMTPTEYREMEKNEKAKSA